uniref:Uncharacterized protein n=1 Tax=Myotis myotis TaxID=51298 RepID=A0A7J7T5Q5_MYOMY|nr:hypothetical protein mMyoMyo1_009160 [Myotis myotis]
MGTGLGDSNQGRSHFHLHRKRLCEGTHPRPPPPKPRPLWFLGHTGAESCPLSLTLEKAPQGEPQCPGFSGGPPVACPSERATRTSSPTHPPARAQPGKSGPNPGLWGIYFGEEQSWEGSLRSGCRL